MSDTDDVGNSPEEAATPSNVDAGETISPDLASDARSATPASDTKRRRVVVRSLTVAGAVSAVAVVLALTFGAGVWAGSELSDEHGRGGHGSSESHERAEFDGDHDGDEHRFRDGPDSKSDDPGRTGRS